MNDINIGARVEREKKANKLALGVQPLSSFFRSCWALLESIEINRASEHMCSRRCVDYAGFTIWAGFSAGEEGR